MAEMRQADPLRKHMANCPHLTRHGRVLVQGQVRANLVVISLIRMKQIAKMPFAKDDHMVKTVAPDRADQPLHVSVLPWRARRDRSVANAQMKPSP